MGEAASYSRAALGVALEGVDSHPGRSCRDLLALSRVDDAGDRPGRGGLRRGGDPGAGGEGDRGASRAHLRARGRWPPRPAPSAPRSGAPQPHHERARGDALERARRQPTSASWCARPAPAGPWSRSATTASGSRPSTRRRSSIRSSPRSRREKDGARPRDQPAPGRRDGRRAVVRVDAARRGAPSA